MNKIIIAVGVMAVLLLVWLGFRADTIDYVGVIDDEISQLEADLAKVEVEVSTGTLTPKGAMAVQDRISSRLNLINSTMFANKGVVLSDIQQTQLLAGLDRLKKMLVSYQATLVVVDEFVLTLPESKRPNGSRGGSTLSDSLSDVITVVEDTAIEMTDDYEPDEIIDVPNSTDDVIGESDDGMEESNDSDEAIEDGTQSADTITEDESIEGTEDADVSEIGDESIGEDIQVN